ncbi:MAG: hypothetical protein WC598_04675 [Methanoregula sp.]
MQSDAGIEVHGNEPGQQEKLITSMENSVNDGSEERIAVLERKLQDMEPLVKGLIAELLDFKALAMSMSREAEERSRQELKQGQVVQSTPYPAQAAPYVSASDGSTVVRLRSAHQPDAPAAPPEPEMVRIMQNDGTMKLEPRFGGALNTSTVGYGRTKKGTFATEKQAPLIYAADKEKSDSAKK